MLFWPKGESDMAKIKFYAVRVGRKPGIYRSWADCQTQIDHYSGAQYKSFPNREAAEAFLAGSTAATRPVQRKQPKTTKPEASAVTADIIVYTDGGNRNTGNVQGGQVKPTDRSAWAFQMSAAGKTITGTSGEWGATNNRMEIMALLQALNYLLETKQAARPILVIMDSKYVLNAIQKGWLTGWKKRGWRRAGDQPLANSELWKMIDVELSQFTSLSFKWVKGHATTAGNNLVDQLLNQTMDHMVQGQPIPATNATAKLPGRPATTVQGDLFATTTAKPKPSKPVNASQSPAQPKKTTATPDKLGHFTSSAAQQASVEAMAEIAKNWQDESHR